MKTHDAQHVTLTTVSYTDNFMSLTNTLHFSPFCDTAVCCEGFTRESASMSIAILWNGKSMMGKGISGARWPCPGAVFWHSGQQLHSTHPPPWTGLASKTARGFCHQSSSYPDDWPSEVLIHGSCSTPIILLTTSPTPIGWKPDICLRQSIGWLPKA